MASVAAPNMRPEVAYARLKPQSDAGPEPLEWEPLGPEYGDEEAPDSIAAWLGKLACRTLQVMIPIWACLALCLIGGCGNALLLLTPSTSAAHSAHTLFPGLVLMLPAALVACLYAAWFEARPGGALLDTVALLGTCSEFYRIVCSY